MLARAHSRLSWLRSSPGVTGRGRRFAVAKLVKGSRHPLLERGYIGEFVGHCAVKDS